MNGERERVLKIEREENKKRYYIIISIIRAIPGIAAKYLPLSRKVKRNKRIINNS